MGDIVASDDLAQRIAAVLREHGTPVGMGGELPADEYECCADALLPLIAAECSEAARQAAVRAWNTATLEAFYCGWLHAFAMDAMLGRNPYRAASLARQTGGE